MTGVEPDLVQPYASGPDRVADIWTGPASAATRPAVVFLHGGFWRPEYDRFHARPLCSALRAHGWTVVSVEYRRRPGDPDATTADVSAALHATPRLLAGRPYDGTLLVVGHSAGGHLALWAASAAGTVALAGVLALAPVADLRLAEELRLGNDAVTAMLGGPAVARPDLDPARRPPSPAPLVILHGDADQAVPIALSESFTATHPYASLHRIPAAGHFDLIDPDSNAFAGVLAQLEHLAGGSTIKPLS